MEKYSIDTYAVMGNPIAHSKSPFIHEKFAKQTQQHLQYIKILVPLDDFTAAIKEFQQQGGKGLNITLPFKQQAFELVNTCSERAQLAGAVNTIVFKSDGSLFGDNTDGVGLLHDLTHNAQYNLNHKRILVLGGSGAVQGILAPLLSEHPECIVIANRTIAKAEKLADKFSPFGKIKSCEYSALPGQQFDLIINGTSASLRGELPPLPANLLNKNGCCYDLAYATEPTVFMQWGKQQGAEHCYDGIGMLVEQGAEAFYLWRGVHPETQSVIKALR
jgi:shikimate dehydrogenase